MGLTAQNLHDIGVVGVVSGTLSVASSLFVIITYFIFPALRNFKTRLIVYMNVACLLWIGFTLISMCFYVGNKGDANPIPHDLCIAQAFFLQWFIVAYDFWIATIAIYVYLRVRRSHWLDDREWVAHAICWGVPFLISLLPFFGVGKGYGRAGAWCWVVDPLARLFFSYLPVWTVFTLICVLYGKILLEISNTNKQMQNMESPEKKPQDRYKLLKKVFKRLALYPVLFFILWIPATVNRIQNFAAPEDPIPNLYKVHIFFTFGTSFFNFFVYGIFHIRYIINRTLSRSTDLPSGSLATAVRSHDSSNNSRNSVSVSGNV